MVSERFKRALKDYKEICDRGGLAQDDTVDKAFEAIQALANKIYIIGLEEGLNRDQIRNEILSTRDLKFKMENKTIYDELAAIMQINDKPPVRNTQDTDLNARLIPHTKEVARAMFMQLLEKFNNCSELEKRQIVRSDEEFFEAMKGYIANAAGFEMEELFGGLPKLNVPRLPRNNELLWSALGDPISEPNDLKRRLQYLSGLVIQKFMELYPDICERLNYGKVIGEETIALNINNPFYTKLETSYQEAERIDNYYDFDQNAIPLMIDALAIKYLVGKGDSYRNARERNKIKSILLDNVNSLLEAQKFQHYNRIDGIT